MPSDVHSVMEVMDKLQFHFPSSIVCFVKPTRAFTRTHILIHRVSGNQESKSLSCKMLRKEKNRGNGSIIRLLWNYDFGAR